MLPKHILKSAEKNLTSLGDNPCLPPEEETNFIVNILTRYYDKLTDGKNINEQQIQEELKKLIIQCQKLEKENVNALEKICLLQSLIGSIFFFSFLVKSYAPIRL